MIVLCDLWNAFHIRVNEASVLKIKYLLSPSEQLIFRKERNTKP